MRAAAILCLALFSFPSAASASESQHDYAARASDVFREVAQQTGVSHRLLHAVALTESGRAGIPWPWTLNVQGRSLYFRDREAAHAALVTLLRRGYRSIDVGLMQVNLAHNGWRFRDSRAALDPAANVRVAAEILRENHRDTGSVRHAVALYHSSTPWRAGAYLARVTHNYASFDAPRAR